MQLSPEQQERSMERNILSTIGWGRSIGLCASRARSQLDKPEAKA